MRVKEYDFKSFYGNIQVINKTKNEQHISFANINDFINDFGEYEIVKIEKNIVYQLLIVTVIRKI